jgi:hypothetical protein
VDVGGLRRVDLDFGRADAVDRLDADRVAAADAQLRRVRQIEDGALVRGRLGQGTDAQC